MPKPEDHEEARAFARGSSGSTADLAVEGAPNLQDQLVDSPSFRRVRPLKPGEKPDQLADKTAAAGDHQEALLDEAIEESFPGSDPVSIPRVD